jgi:hypothetical protein
MNLHIGVMAHAIPNTTRVAFPAVEVLPVKQPVLVANRVFKPHTGFTVGTRDIPNSVFLHDAIARELVFAAQIPVTLHPCFVLPSRRG